MSKEQKPQQRAIVWASKPDDKRDIYATATCVTSDGRTIYLDFGSIDIVDGVKRPSEPLKAVVLERVILPPDIALDLIQQLQTFVKPTPTAPTGTIVPNPGQLQ